MQKSSFAHAKQVALFAIRLRSSIHSIAKGLPIRLKIVHKYTDYQYKVNEQSDTSEGPPRGAATAVRPRPSRPYGVTVVRRRQWQHRHSKANRLLGFPLQEIALYFTDRVILLPGEY
jgi:hypothetical protein